MTQVSKTITVSTPVTRQVTSKNAEGEEVTQTITEVKTQTKTVTVEVPDEGNDKKVDQAEFKNSERYQSADAQQRQSLDRVYSEAATDGNVDTDAEFEALAQGMAEEQQVDDALATIGKGNVCAIDEPKQREFLEASETALANIPADHPARSDAEEQVLEQQLQYSELYGDRAHPAVQDLVPPEAAAPVATDPPTPAQPPAPKIYEVQPGDTLNKIAQRNGMTLDQLREANPQLFQNGKDDAGRKRDAGGNLIYPGDQVKIPQPPPPAGQTPATPTDPAAPAGTKDGKEAAKYLQENFDKVAGSDGKVSREDIKANVPEGPGREELLKNFDTLIFGKIEQGDEAWSNLSRDDVDKMVEGSAEGGLQAYADGLASKIIQERGVTDATGDGKVDAADLSKYVEANRPKPETPEVAEAKKTIDQAGLMQGPTVDPNGFKAADQQTVDQAKAALEKIPADDPQRAQYEQKVADLEKRFEERYAVPTAKNAEVQEKLDQASGAAARGDAAGYDRAMQEAIEEADDPKDFEAIAHNAASNGKPELAAAARAAADPKVSEDVRKEIRYALQDNDNTNDDLGDALKDARSPEDFRAIAAAATAAQDTRYNDLAPAIAALADPNLSPEVRTELRKALDDTRNTGDEVLKALSKASNAYDQEAIKAVAATLSGDDLKRVQERADLNQLSPEVARALKMEDAAKAIEATQAMEKRLSEKAGHPVDIRWDTDRRLSPADMQKQLEVLDAALKDPNYETMWSRYNTIEFNTYERARDSGDRNNLSHYAEVDGGTLKLNNAANDGLTDVELDKQRRALEVVRNTGRGS